MAFCRIKDLKNTPIYVRPQFSSGGGVVTLTMMVGIRANIGKPVDNITVQLLLPPSVVSSDLTANFGTILPNHGTKVLSSIPIWMQFTSAFKCHSPAGVTNFFPGLIGLMLPSQMFGLLQ